LNLFEFKT
jgi:hypothetical protein